MSALGGLVEADGGNALGKLVAPFACLALHGHRALCLVDVDRSHILGVVVFQHVAIQGEQGLILVHVELIGVVVGRLCARLVAASLLATASAGACCDAIYIHASVGGECHITILIHGAHAGLLVRGFCKALGDGEVGGGEGTCGAAAR